MVIVLSELKFDESIAYEGVGQRILELNTRTSLGEYMFENHLRTNR